MAPPFKQATFDILYGEGISRTGEIIDIGSDLGVIEKSGAWYSYNGQKIAQGKEKAREYLASNPAVCEEIEHKIRELKGAHGKGVPVANTASEETHVSAEDELDPIGLGDDIDL